MSASRLYMAGPSDEGMRLDALLAERGLFQSRSAGAKAIEAGDVLVNGKTASKKDAVRSGQAIVYEVPDEAPKTPAKGEPIDLDVRYEDDDIIVLSKQAGLVCHPSEDRRDGTLVNALIYRYGAAGLCNVQGEADRLGIVHRLDMDTTGLMLAAKTDRAGEALMDAIRDRVVDRHYLALVHGIIAPNTGLVDAPIARHAKERLRMAVRDCDSAREAITTFAVLERFQSDTKDNGYTLIECKLFTGRTHQIRVHMEYTRHPLVGDPLYKTFSPKSSSADLGLRRQFLHSYKLGLHHPFEDVDLQFLDNVPDDLSRVLDGLSDRSLGKTDAGLALEEALRDAPHPSIEGIPYLDQ